MQPLSRLTASLAVRLARCVATPRLQIGVMTIIRDRLASLSAEEAARFALTLDAQLYAIHGRLAVAYGQGECENALHLPLDDADAVDAEPVGGDGQ